MHSTLAVNENGVPLRILHPERWTRDDAEYSKKAERHQQPPGENDSQKWLDGQPETLELLENVPKVVTIAAREADTTEEPISIGKLTTPSPGCYMSS